MNWSARMPVIVLKDISAFVLRNRDFNWDSDRDIDRSKYKLLITFIHIGPHGTLIGTVIGTDRDIDWNRFSV